MVRFHAQTFLPIPLTHGQWVVHLVSSTSPPPVVGQAIVIPAAEDISGHFSF